MLPKNVLKDLIMLIKYDFTDEQLRLKELARKIASQYIKPISKKIDETGEFPADSLKILADNGLAGITIPKKYGGQGLGLMEFSLVNEEIARIDASVSASFAASLLGTIPIMLFGTEEQKLKYLPPLARGEQLASFALSEPVAGSDAADIKTKAVFRDGYYHIDGKKRFITNAGESRVYTVFTMTDPKKGPRGITAFIIEKGAEGMTFGPKHQKMGIRASATCNIDFKDVKVSKENILGGREGMGFIHILRTFELSRPGVGAQAVGIAQGAFDIVLNFTRHRKQFGKPVNTFQGMQWMMADMEIKIEAARSLTYNVIRMVDRGEKNINPAAAMAKVFASDVAMEVTTNAVQMLGGWGYMREFEVERYMRDAKVTQIYEGTNQIQRNIIALSLIKEL